MRIVFVVVVVKVLNAVLASGGAAEDGAQTPVCVCVGVCVEERVGKENFFLIFFEKKYKNNYSSRRKNFGSLARDQYSPSHPQSKQSINLTVVGEKNAESLVFGCQLESSQIAETRNSVFVIFDEVNCNQNF